MAKEDLIGTMWQCPRCGVETEVTAKGISHRCKEDKSWAELSLDTYYHYKKSADELVNRLNKALLYGD